MSKIKDSFKRILRRYIPGMRELTAEIHELRREVGRLRRDQDCDSRDLLILSTHIEQEDPEIFRIPDQKETERQFKAILGYPLNLKAPRTFNEKLMWLIYNQRDPMMPILADKYRVREHLRNLGLSRYLNHLHGVFKNTDDLLAAWESLPNSFVVKTNHYSNANTFVKNKDTFDKKKLNPLEEALQSNYFFKRAEQTSPTGFVYYVRRREWPYRNISPLLTVEEYLEDASGELRDYKVFCFNGQPRYIQVHFGRFSTHTQTFYDTDWEPQKFTTTMPREESIIPRPEKLEEMLEVAATLSRGFPFLRVDFYIAGDGRLYFGETTFYHNAGIAKFTPPEWDMTLGNLIQLPEASLAPKDLSMSLDSRSS